MDSIIPDADLKLRTWVLVIYKVNAPRRRIRVVRMDEKQVLKGGKPRKGEISEKVSVSA